jgi:uncharacterized membrane protein YfhO
MLTDTNFPGWRASIDGKPTPILTANYLFRGVLVPAGRSIVAFDYWPNSFVYGAYISAASLVVVLMLLVLPKMLACRRGLGSTSIGVEL